MSERPTAENDACVCPSDYCLDDAADPDACQVCKRLDLYDLCPRDPVWGGVYPSGVKAGRDRDQIKESDSGLARAWDEGWAARAEYESRRDVPLDWPDRNPYRAIPPERSTDA